MDNEQGAIAVPLSLYGGLNLELAPSDLPEGISPNCQDVIFLPGSVSSRPGTHSIFPTGAGGFDPGYNINYQKSFVTPTGNTLNLYLQADGTLWVEDVGNSPGTITQIGNGGFGSYAISASTPFGREYIAFSDGVHGTLPPVQYDGTNVDPVSQYGPGTPPTLADLPNTLTVTSINPAVPFTNIAASPTGLTEVGNTVTVTTTAAHGLTTGDSVLIGTPNPWANNLDPVVVTVTSATTFTYFLGTTGLSPSGGGQVYPIKMVVTTVQPHGLAPGATVVIQGDSAALQNSNTTAQIGTTGISKTTPPQWTVVTTPSPTTFTYIGVDSDAGTGGSANVSMSASSVTAGVHNCVVMFETRTEFITAPSPLTTVTASGGGQIQVSNIPIGPPNTIARILAFTMAGGANYFYIPVTPYDNGVQVGTSTVINDNTSTTATVNFSDSLLASATAIDVTGNNLFEMLAIGPCLGTFEYSQRTMFWGMDNEVDNLLNMDFCGGYIGSPTAPTGWTVAPAGGGKVSSTPGPNQQTGGEWLITGTGGTDGQISQNAYQDQLGVAILKPKTQYTVKVWGISPSATSGATVVVDLYSPAHGGVLASASFAADTVFGPAGAMVSKLMSGLTPATIPPDTVLRVYSTGAAGGKQVGIYRVSLIYTANPYINNRAIMSYVGAPSQLDQLTGFIGPADDPSPIVCCSILRDTLRIKCTGGMHNTQDDGTSEPSGWTVSSFSRTVGAVSIRGGDPGRFGSGDTAEDWDLTAAYGGMYIDFGGDLYKVSQEVQNIWDNINHAALPTLWIKNDVVTRRVYIGVPRGTATIPNVLLVWDYRELDAALQIATAAPVHISFTGKMISSDLTRKWTVWNLPMASGEILNRPGNVRTMCLGTGNATSSGPRPNIYYLDPAKLTDDDFGQIFPSYTTYAFLNHEAEVALGTGLHRKLYRYLTLFASGVGQLSITQLADNLSNVWETGPAFPLQTSPTYDIEWGLNVLCERCFFRLASAPITGTDNSFTLNKMVVSIQAEPHAPVRGSW